MLRTWISERIPSMYLSHAGSQTWAYFYLFHTIKCYFFTFLYRECRENLIKICSTQGTQGDDNFV